MSQVGYKPLSRYSEGIKSVPTYVEFGKFVIHKKKLLDNILIIKYKNSKAPVPSIKQQTITEPYAILLLNLLDTQAINYELVKDCDDTDRKKFEDLIKRADLLRVLNYDKTKALKTDADIITRYDCLKGELLAGNDNLDIRKELKDVVKLLCEKGKISKEDGRELMNELFG
jgi:hypothetical protein